jgi:hypothetical protein
MMLRGATNRVLSGAVGLGVVVLGLLLSFVPAWAQPAPEVEARKEALNKLGGLIEIELSDEQAPLNNKKAETGGAGSDLKALEADVKRKQAELAALKARLEQARKRLEAKAKVTEERVRARLVRAGQLAAGEAKKGGVTIRIEISGLEGKPEELKALLERLEKELPGKDRTVIINRGSAPYGLWQLSPAPPARPPAAGGASTPAPRAITIPPAGVRIERAPGKPEARTDELEKKLDNLLKELSELRQELKGRPLRNRPGAGK